MWWVSPYKGLAEDKNLKRSNPSATRACLLCMSTPYGLVTIVTCK